MADLAHPPRAQHPALWPRAGGRVDELEGLRGLMAWWVVLGHLAYTFSDHLGRLAHNKSPVYVFIALSGFAIMSLLDSRAETYRAFLTRRVFRLYPLYLLLLLVSLPSLGAQAEAWAALPGARNATRLALTEAAHAAPLAHLGAHIAMLHGLVPTWAVPRADISILGQAWSISVEFQFYLLAPLVHAGLTQGWLGRAAVALGAVGLYAAATVPGLAGNSAFIGPYVGWFGLGIAAFFAWKAGHAAALLALAAFCSGVAVALREPGALVWAAVCVLLSGRGRLARARAVLKTPAARWLGKISYSTYLVHMLPMAAALWFANGRLSGVAHVGFVSACTLAGTLVLSWALYRAVEAPGMALGAALTTRDTDQHS